MENKKKAKSNFSLVLMLLGGIILFAVLVLAVAPNWDAGFPGTSFYFEEGQLFSYNFSQNVSDADNDALSFEIRNLSSNLYSLEENSFFYWVNLNSITGNLSINSTIDNQTGEFNISIDASDGSESAGARLFYFIVNATNDAPNFTNISTIYNLSQNENFFRYINASDEEEHYPLYYNISFLDTCSYAIWSTRTNCTLFNISSINNISAIINFTPTKNDVGVYYANVSIRDYGENYTCSSLHCSANYQQNKSDYRIVTFNVLSTLEVNITDCQNKLFQENQSGTCYINITTRGKDDILNISSIGFLKNYVTSVSNTTWFYNFNITGSENFSKIIMINATPGKTEVGNWTINFTVNDISFSQSVTEAIYVLVNRTYNDAPEIAFIPNVTTSVNLSTRINLTVFDDDLLIPDKNAALGGYNETINFTVVILNMSDLSQELDLTGFDVEILNMPVAGTNRTEAKIQFTPNSSESGDYTINISIRDRDNVLNTTNFNISILSNSAPVWNDTLDIVVLIIGYEDNETYLNLSQNVSDPDGDSLTFSFTNDTSFNSLSIGSATGVINITPNDYDVGQHLITITANDGYLSASKSFNFTVYNVNDMPKVERPIISASVINASVDSNSNMNATEDNITTIYLWIQDDDFKIPTVQEGFYNENLTISVNISGANSNLISFTIDSSFTNPQTNRTKYNAVFTPRKSDVGQYNITLNISDMSNASDIFQFNLTVQSKNHPPYLDSIVNQTSKINTSFYYRMYANDTEDGNSNATGGNLNITFNYTFVSGAVIFNSSIFNSTTGAINITFNSSQGGKYHINITVNDSSGLINSKDFWIFVYDFPNITSPLVSYLFNLSENQTYYLNFTANHSVGDNLTYQFYIDNSNNTNILRYNLSYYGNATNLTWQFSPNLTDETYNLFRNLTLKVINPIYPELNTSITWNITISHTNAPVVLSGHLGDTQANYNQNIEIDLSQYFSDIDYSDAQYNQTINFTVTSNSTPSYITSSVSSSWILTLSSLIAITELINVNASDSSTSAVSNSFQVQFTTPTTTPAESSSGGGGGGGSPVSLKIIMPDPISGYYGKKIIVPITLQNNGKSSLNSITLTGMVAKDSKLAPGINLKFSKSYFNSLGKGEKENLTLEIDINTEEKGKYEITINGSVKNPKYEDWGKLYLTIAEINKTDVEEKILFTEELIVNNPECIEIKEMVEEAKDYYLNNQLSLALEKADEAINACRSAISQVSKPRLREKLEDKFYKYLSVFTLVVFVFGIFYYSYKKIKLRRTIGI